ncbi:MAG: response regulator [Moorellales bacterium]
MSSRVLVVDDSLTARKYCAKILSSAGFHVEEAANGYEALEKCLQQDYDVILADVNMPKMSGYELVQELRRQAETAHTPVVMISTEAGEDDRLEGYRAGANLFLVKPVSPEALVIIVRAFARGHCD